MTRRNFRLNFRFQPVAESYDAKLLDFLKDCPNDGKDFIWSAAQAFYLPLALKESGVKGKQLRLAAEGCALALERQALNLRLMHGLALPQPVATTLPTSQTPQEKSGPSDSEEKKEPENDPQEGWHDLF